MNKKIVLYLFFIGSFVGTFVDVGYRAVIGEYPVYQSFLSKIFGVFIPLLPIYGLGLVLIYLLHPFARKINFPSRLVLYGLSLSLLELIGGLFVFLTIKTRLWDYSESPFNVFGFVDMLHFVYWMFLGTAIYYVFEKYQNHLSNSEF